jgi:hypothetical protein
MGASSRSTLAAIDGHIRGGGEDAQREYSLEKMCSSRQQTPSSGLLQRVAVSVEPRLATYVGGAEAHDDELIVTGKWSEAASGWGCAGRKKLCSNMTCGNKGAVASGCGNRMTRRQKAWEKR